MEEVGLDLSKEFPKPLTADIVEVPEVGVRMGCGDACPFFPKVVPRLGADRRVW